MLLAIFLVNIFYGAVKIPASEVLGILKGDIASNVSWQYIVMSYRFPQALTALLTGSVLSVCGLMLQAIFRNPLADASILGISSGAGLGVACVMMLFGGGLYIGGLSFGGFAAVFAAALSGALAVTFIMLFISSFILDLRFSSKTSQSNFSHILRYLLVSLSQRSCHLHLHLLVQCR